MVCKVMSMAMARKRSLCWWLQQLVLVACAVVWMEARRAEAIRFVIDKKECWSHDVPYDGDMVHVSYVVIKSESAWNFDHTAVGLDLVVSAFSSFSPLLSCLLPCLLLCVDWPSIRET